LNEKSTELKLQNVSIHSSISPNHHISKCEYKRK
jgi:hypothetical protein